MNKLLIYLLPIGIIGGIFFYQDYQIKGMRKEMVELGAENAKLHQTLQTQIKSQELLKKNFSEYKTNIEEINKKFKTHRNEVSALEQKLSKHNLTKLIKAKPKMMENIINKGTAKVFKQIETTTEFKEAQDEQVETTTSN